MTVYGKLGKYSKHKLEIETDDELDIYKIGKYANGRQVSVSVEIEDGRRISPDQRKKTYALIHDVCDYLGYPDDAMEAWFKYKFIQKKGIEWFSLSDCSMSLAASFLTFILDVCFEQDIPFRTKTWDMIPTDYHLTLQCLKHRKCVICGKRAQFAHVNAVGMGVNRNKVDHTKRFVMPLCVNHHTEQHNKGINSFINYYHIKPVKPDLETLRILKVRGDYEDEEELDGTTKDVQ